MNPPPAAPSGRVLAGWWRQFAPQNPRRLWLIDWLIHRFEVLACGTRSEPLEPLQRLLLESLALARSAGVGGESTGFVAVADENGFASAVDVAQRLGINAGLAVGMLNDAAKCGLTDSQGGHGWRLTELGREAITNGAFAHSTYERKTFYLRNEPPVFLPLKDGGRAVSIIETPPAPLAELQRCADRTDAWKERVGFPMGVAAIMDMAAPLPANIEPWMRIPIDQPERLLGAMIQTDRRRIIVHAAKPEDWSLHSEPALDLDPDAAHELLPLSDKTADAWRQPWSHWCRVVRGITAAEADAASLEKSDHRLIVKAPALADRLRLARTELFRGEAWLLAGEPHTREAVQIELKV